MYKLLILLTIFSSAQAVMIEDGPFKGHAANFDEEIDAWVIAGDLSKAPPMSLYDGTSITAGVSSRSEEVGRQPGFKKIWLLQGTEGEWYKIKNLLNISVDDLNFKY
jgi:hypothetical protein